MNKTDKLIAVLQEEIVIMDKASQVLALSYSRCEKIIDKPDYTEDETEALEALTSRFARLSDILLQKTWRTLFTLEFEEDGTPRDRINKAEKKELIASASSFLEMRILRNKIAHEYNVEDTNKLHKEVYHAIPELLDAVKRLHHYVIEKKLI
jgi:hypothetical protein